MDMLSMCMAIVIRPSQIRYLNMQSLTVNLSSFKIDIKKPGSDLGTLEIPRFAFSNTKSFSPQNLILFFSGR